MRLFVTVTLSTILVLSALFAKAEQIVVQTSVQQDTAKIDNVELNELVVKESLVKHSAKGDTYKITEAMRRGIDGTMQLLGRLPGVVYDNVNNSVTVRNDSKVQIIVNGNQVDNSYLNAISPERVDRVEVIYVPSARYTAAGYRYVIDIKLKPEYRGHDIYVGNFMMVSAGDNNGDDVVANEQPQFMYMYSGDKVDFNVGYAFGEINWNYPLSYTKSYPGITDISTDKYTEKNPNDHNHNRTHAAFAGLDWHIRQQQTLSLRASYENIDLGRTVENCIHTTDAAGMKQLHDEVTVSDQQSDQFTGAMLYRGNFNEKWDIFASLGYDRWNADALNYYSLTGSYASRNLYRNSRDYLNGNFDLTFSINEKMSLNIGYLGTWNRYDTYMKHDNRLVAQTIDSRHHAYACYDFMPLGNLLLHFGIGFEHIGRTGLGGIDKDYNNLLPQATLTYLPSETVRITADYNANMEYPLQYQLSAAGYDIDSLMHYEGNTLLAPARTHRLSLSVGVGDAFYASVEYNNTHDFLTEWYAPLVGGKFLSTFGNSRYHNFKAMAGYDWKISKYVVWSNTLQLSYDKIRLGSIADDYVNFNMVSELRYWLNPWRMQLVGTYSRNMVREPQLQGWSDYGQDMWQVAVQKAFFDNCLAVSLIYVPPLHLGVRRNQRSCVETPFYHTVQSLNLKTYDNMVLLRLQFRFNAGKLRRDAFRDNFNVTKEQKKDRGLM